MYDFVGDIHGHADALKALLLKLDYQFVNGIWQHPKRILVALGDLVDRGPGQKEVVNILRNMQQAGKAEVIMGNHEFYAIAWHQKDEQGNPIREHSEKNLQEHQAFLDQSQPNSAWYLEALEWFKTLPLYLDTPQFKCIHAAWDDKRISHLQQYTNAKGVILEHVWQQPSKVDPSFYRALEYCLNGPKIRLPEGARFTDSAGRVRTKMRLKWWDIPSHATYRNACTSVPDPNELPDDALSLSAIPNIQGNQPIFFGHYWMQGQPHLMKSNVACLDWSVVQDDGVLAAYRFDGEQILEQKKLVWV